MALRHKKKSLAPHPAKFATRQEKTILAVLGQLHEMGFTAKDIEIITKIKLRPGSNRINKTILTQLAGNARFQEITEIFNLANQAFGLTAPHWFFNPNSHLGNVLPATLLRDPENGPNLVKQVLYNSLRGRLA